MNTQDVNYREKERLKELICPRSLYGIWQTPLSKSEFLCKAWSGIADSVIYNRDHQLIAQAVERYRDLISRMYAYLSILHGTHSINPNLKSVLDDFVSHIDNDLDTSMEKICAYAASKDRYCAFFLEPYVVWKSIERIYLHKEESLPPTPYQAFALFMLNRTEKVLSHCFTDETMEDDLRCIIKNMGQISHCLRARR